MVVADHLLVELHLAADVSHGIAAAANITRVGCTAVNDAAVMEAALIGLKFDGDRLAGVALHGLDLIGEYCRAWFEIIVIGEALFAGGVRARYDIHATVFLGRRIDCYPYRDDLHWRDHTLPVVRILMPRNPLTVALGLADKVTGEQCDVRAKNGLDEIENFVGKEPFEQFRVLEVGNIHRFGSHIGLEVVEDVFEAILQPFKFCLRQDGLTKDVITFLVIFRDFLCGESV